MVILQLNEKQLFKKWGVKGTTLGTQEQFHWWRSPESCSGQSCDTLHLHRQQLQDMLNVVRWMKQLCLDIPEKHRRSK